MPMESQVKFYNAQNIAGPSQQNSSAAVSAEADGDYTKRIQDSIQCVWHNPSPNLVQCYLKPFPGQTLLYLLGKTCQHLLKWVKKVNHVSRV